MKHLASVMKVIDAAWHGDKEKCANYLEFLCDQMEQDGETTEARLLRDKLAVLQGKKKEVVIVPLDQKPA